MRRIIVIGECGLDVIYAGGQPCGSMPSGRLVNMAMMLARSGHPVVMAGDTGADELGGIVVSALAAGGVDVSSVDRYADGMTPVYFYVGADVSAYRVAPAEGGFDIVWPRINPGDVVVFGGYYAIDPAIHQRVSALVAHAVERKALVVYLPGFMPRLAPRLTRVMPSILENMEMSSLVITRPADLSVIYGERDAATSFADHISYYAPMMMDIDACGGKMAFLGDNFQAQLRCPGAADSLLWNSSAAAAAIEALYRVVEAGTTNPSIQEIYDELAKLNGDFGHFIPADAPLWQRDH